MVTIVVLLILAGITIQLVLNDGGVFSQAQRSKEQTRIGKLLDKFNVSEATVALEKFGKPSLEDFINQVQNKEGYVIEAEKEGEKNYTVTTEDGYVFDVSIIEGTTTNDIIIEYVGKADSMPPKPAIVEFSSTETEAETAVTATVTHVPNTNPIAIENCKWIYSKESSKIGKDNVEWNSEKTGSFTSNGQTIDLNTDEGGSFYLHVLSVDSEGKKRETVAGPITIKPKPAEEFSRANGSIDIAFVNMSNQPISGSSVPTPTLGEGMVPVKWNEQEKSWYICQSTDSEWYSYTEKDKKWANVMLRDGLVVEGITNAETASIEEMANKKVTTVGSMFVYVPRYGYKITYTPTDGATTILGYSNSIGITNKSGGVVPGTEKQGAIEIKGNLDGKQIEKYVLHPAFTVNEENGGWKDDITGIWIAKFLASSVEGNKNNITADNVTTKTIQVKPGKYIWRYISADVAFQNCQNYKKTLQSHLMKNSEQGCALYLAKSKYGINGRIDPNNGTFTGGEASDGYQIRSNQTTTGNIYGIYDMGNEIGEHVAAYLDNQNAILMDNGKSLIEGENYLKNTYIKSEKDDSYENYSINAGKYGDAMFETSFSGGAGGTASWYGGRSGYMMGSTPFVIRGKKVSTSGNAAAFSFEGREAIAYAFRPIIIISNK